MNLNVDVFCCIQVLNEASIIRFINIKAVQKYSKHVRDRKTDSHVRSFHCLCFFAKPNLLFITCIFSDKNQGALTFIIPYGKWPKILMKEFIMSYDLSHVYINIRLWKYVLLLIPLNNDSCYPIYTIPWMVILYKLSNKMTRKKYCPACCDYMLCENLSVKFNNSFWSIGLVWCLEWMLFIHHVPMSYLTNRIEFIVTKLLYWRGKVA